MWGGGGAQGGRASGRGWTEAEDAKCETRTENHKRNFMERCKRHTKELMRAISEALGKALGEHVWDVLCNSSPLKVKLVWLHFE